MIDFFVKLGHFFKKEDYPKFFLFFLGMFLNSILEIIGIGLLMPFMALLSKPESVMRNPFMSRVYHSFSFGDYRQFIMAIAIGIIVIYVVKSGLLLFISYWQSRFIFEKQALLMSRLFRAYLMSPYSFHLKESLAKLQRNLGAVNSIMQGLVLQLFYALTEGVVVLSLFMVLLWTQFLLTLAIFLILGVSLFLYFRLIRKRMHAWVQSLNHHTTLMLQRMNQGLGSIKEAKLFGKEKFLADRYNFHCEQSSAQSTKLEVVSRTPRTFVEVILITLVMLMVVFYLMIGKSTDQIFAIISLFALASIRLMPSISRISSAVVIIRSYTPIFNEVYDDLKNCEQMNIIEENNNRGRRLDFLKNIEIKDVTFLYENSPSKALNRASFVIPKNSTVGFVGSSGAGKTTVIDIILGLLKPSEGRITIDGKDIYQNIRSWQDKIGYIPQAIYLCDDTIKNNIAFGYEENDVDEEKVWTALRLSQLEEFVRGLPNGLETTVGERGIRLSGGQRQRIGIARALYNAPEVLVMDEATAALDNETERVFMESLTSLSGEKTILIIAHRLSTVRKCDVIFFMKNGQVLDTGRYDELLGRCPDFRQMATGERF